MVLVARPVISERSSCFKESFSRLIWMTFPICSLFIRNKLPILYKSTGLFIKMIEKGIILLMILIFLKRITRKRQNQKYNSDGITIVFHLFDQLLMLKKAK